jgi:hypothetical protein
VLPPQSDALYASARGQISETTRPRTAGDLQPSDIARCVMEGLVSDES